MSDEKKLFVSQKIKLNGKPYWCDPYEVSLSFSCYEGYDPDNDPKRINALKGNPKKEALKRYENAIRSAMDLPKPTIDEEGNETQGYTQDEVFTLWDEFGEWCNKKKESIVSPPTSQQVTVSQPPKPSRTKRPKKGCAVIQRPTNSSSDCGSTESESSSVKAST